jgi:hypothetical protein
VTPATAREILRVAPVADSMQIRRAYEKLRIDVLGSGEDSGETLRTLETARDVLLALLNQVPVEASEKDHGVGDGAAADRAVPLFKPFQTEMSTPPGEIIERIAGWSWWKKIIVLFLALLGLKLLLRIVDAVLSAFF